MADKNALTAELARKLAKARRKAKRWRGTAAAWKDRHDEVLDANAALGSIATTMATEVDRLREQVDTATAQVGRLAAAEARAEELEASVAELRESYDLIQAARQRELRTWEAQRSEGQAHNERLILANQELRLELSATKSELAQMTVKRDEARANADQELSRTQEALDRITELEDVLQAHRMADDQVGRLARFIADVVPGEPSRSEGAVDTAIRLLQPLATFRQQLAKAAAAERAAFPLRTVDVDALARFSEGGHQDPGTPAEPLPDTEPVVTTNEADFTDCSGPKHCRGGSGRHHAHKWWDDHEPDAERWYCDGSATYDLLPGQCGWDVLGFACTLPEDHEGGHVSAGGGAYIASPPADDPIEGKVGELADLLPDVDEELAEYGTPGLARPLAVGTPEQLAAYAASVETPLAPVADEVRGPVYEPLDESQHDPHRTVDASELTAAAETLAEDEAIVDTYAAGTLRQALEASQDAIAEVLRTHRHDEGWCDDPDELADEIIDAVAPPELSPAQQLTADVDVWLSQNVANVEKTLDDCVTHAKGGMSSPGQWYADLCSWLDRRNGGAGHVIGPDTRDAAWQLATEWALEVVEEGSRELTVELEQLTADVNLARDALTNALGEKTTCESQLTLRQHQVGILRTSLFGPDQAPPS